MPTYNYRRADGSVFEVTQKISDPKLTQDPDTGEPIERMISGGAGLQFKGSGFYLTDYARSGSKPDASESGEASASKVPGTEKAPTKTAAPSPAPKASGPSSDD